MNLLKQLEEQRKVRASKVNKKLRKRLIEDREYRNIVKRFIDDLDTTEYVADCLKHDLNTVTGYPNMYYDCCGGKNYCDCDRD